MSLRCSYEDCLSIKYPCSVITFFSLPTDERRSIWIRNSGNKSLLNIKPDAKRYFCEKHFNECDIRNPFNRKTLLKHAVPLQHPSVASKEANDVEFTFMKTVRSKAKNTRLIDNLDKDSSIKNHNQVTVLENITETDSADDGTSSIPYSFFGEDDGGDELSTTRTVVETSTEDDTNTQIKETVLDNSSLELLIGDSVSNCSNEVHSSTIEIVNTEGDTQGEHIELLDFDEANEGDITPKAKKMCPNESHIHVEALRNEINELVTTTPAANNNNNDSYEEDKHFLLSLVGYFQRLPQTKKSLAKLKILQYLTQLELDYPPCM